MIHTKAEDTGVPSTGRGIDLWYVQFAVSGQRYGLPQSSIDRIVQMAELIVPPTAPRCLAGFLNVAGELVAVVRLSTIFSAAEVDVGCYTPLLVLSHRKHALALQVDRVERVARVDSTQILPVPRGEAFNDCAMGILSVDGERTLLLDPDRLLLEQERMRLAALRDIEQSRLDDLEESANS